MQALYNLQYVVAMAINQTFLGAHHRALLEGGVLQQLVAAYSLSTLQCNAVTATLLSGSASLEVEGGAPPGGLCKRKALLLHQKWIDCHTGLVRGIMFNLQVLLTVVLQQAEGGDQQSGAKAGVGAGREARRGAEGGKTQSPARAGVGVGAGEGSSGSSGTTPAAPGSGSLTSAAGGGHSSSTGTVGTLPATAGSPAVVKQRLSPWYTAVAGCAPLFGQLLAGWYARHAAQITSRGGWLPDTGGWMREQHGSGWREVLQSMGLVAPPELCGEGGEEERSGSLSEEGSALAHFAITVPLRALWVMRQHYRAAAVHAPAQAASAAAGAGEGVAGVAAGAAGGAGGALAAAAAGAVGAGAATGGSSAGSGSAQAGGACQELEQALAGLLRHPASVAGLRCALAAQRSAGSGSPGIEVTVMHPWLRSVLADAQRVAVEQHEGSAADTPGVQQQAAAVGLWCPGVVEFALEVGRVAESVAGTVRGLGAGGVQ